MSTTTHNDIEKAIVGKFKDNWSETDIAYRNVDFTEIGKSAYIAINFAWSDNRKLCICNDYDKGNIFKGILITTVNVLTNLGDKTLLNYADRVKNLFSFLELTISGNNYPIVFYQGYLGEMFDTKIWKFVTVNSPFEYLEG